MNNVDVVIVTYNDPAAVDQLLKSLAKQTILPQRIIIIDNSSNDTTKECIELQYPNVELHKQITNLDFCKGTNLGIKLSTAESVLILNQDMFLGNDCIEKLLQELITDQRMGAVSPTLLRLGENGEKTNVVDSLGIRGTHARRFYNAGEGTEYEKAEQKEVFGVPATALLLRREMITDLITHGGGTDDEFLDANFIAYKDDIDLSYRMRHRGWHSSIASVHAYHTRAARVSAASLKGQMQKSKRVRRLSLRNHWWVLLKNEPTRNLLLLGPLILLREMGKFITSVAVDPLSVQAIVSTVRALPTLLKKRKTILSSSTVSAAELRKAVTQ